MKRFSDLWGFVRHHAFMGTMLVTIAVRILGVAAGVFALNGVTAHRWTHNLPVALLLVGVFVSAQFARIVADIVGWSRGWSIAATLATGALMVWMSVRVWMSIPRTGTAALDGTLLLVVLTPSAVMMAIAETGAQLARDVIENLLPALREPRRAG